MAFHKRLLSRKAAYISILTCILIVFSLELYSTDWVRLKLMEYYLNKGNYVMAIELGMEILRKRAISRQLDKEFIKLISIKLDNSITALVVKEIAVINKEWNDSRTFSVINQSNLDLINSIFERIRFFLEPSISQELNSQKHYNKFAQSLKPYNAQTGYLNNDSNPSNGLLSNFNYSGGFALDCRLRSIGTNLGDKRPVVAIRLRRWTDETRVQPENLSIWISDDNKAYRPYTGSVSFSSETRAILLDHLDFTCQFLKVHCDFKDDQYTFAEDFKNILEVYGPPDFS